MNEVRLTGKVLNCYIDDRTQNFVAKLAVSHDHIVGKQTISCESVFSVIMTDERKIPHLDVRQGDTVLVEGYLKVDIKRSLTGNEHKNLRVYATNIEVTKSKAGFDMVDYTRKVLGIN